MANKFENPELEDEKLLPPKKEYDELEKALAEPREEELEGSELEFDETETDGRRGAATE